MSNENIIQVQEVMREGYLLVDSRATVQETLRQMIDNDKHIVIVDKHSDHDEYGLVRLSDISRKVLAQDKSPNRVNVYEVMSKPALCISGTMDIRHCARMFDRFNLHAAPVVNKTGNIIGAISYEHLVLKGLVQLN